MWTLNFHSGAEWAHIARSCDDVALPLLITSLKDFLKSSEGNPPKKTTHPNRNSLHCLLLLILNGQGGTVCTNCSEIVCAHCALFGWVFLVGLPCMIKALETTTAIKRRKISCTFCSFYAVSNLSFHGCCISRSLHDSAKFVVSWLLARCCSLAVVVSAVCAS